MDIIYMNDTFYTFLIIVKKTFRLPVKITEGVKPFLLGVILGHLELFS